MVASRMAALTRRRALIFRSRVIWRASALSCAIALALLSVTETFADELKRAATLQWVRMPGAEGCSDGLALSRAVDAKLGRAVFTAPSAAMLVVEGRAEHDAEGYRAVVHLLDEAGNELGSREVHSTQSDCKELSEAVAVVLAVMVDPDGALAATPAPSPPAAKAPEPAPPIVMKEGEPPKAPTCPACPIVAPPVRPEADASAFARLSLGQLPRPVFGAGLSFELALPGWGGARIEAVGFQDQSQNLDSVPGAGARLRMLYGGLGLCPMWAENRRMRFAGCAGVQAGVLQSRSYGLDSKERDSTEPIVTGEGAGRYSLRLGKGVALHVGASLLVPIMRPLYEARLHDGTREKLFEPKAIAGAFDFGIGSHF
jgi:hypothetical protein